MPSGALRLILMSSGAVDQSPKILSLSPVDNAVDVPVDGNLVITFDRAIVAGASADVSIHQTSDDALIEALDESDFGGTLTVSGSTLTINPSSNFDGSLGVYVLIDAGSVESETGVPFAGIISKTVWNFTTASGLAAPVLSGLTIDLDGEGASVTSTGGSGTVYAVALTAGSDAPSAAQIKAGTDADDGTDDLIEAVTPVSVSSPGTQVIPFSEGLGEFDLYVVHQNATDFSNVVTASLIAPVLSSLVVTPVDDDEANWSLSTTKTGGTLYGVAYLASKGTPNATQIKAGQAGDSSSAPWTYEETVETIPTQAEGISGLSEENWETAFLHTDAAGNDSNIVSETFTLDVTAPTLASSTPADDATDVAVDADIVLTMSEDVFAGAGDVEERKTSDDSLVDSWTFPDDAGSGAGQFEISGDTVTLHPSDDRENSEEHYVVYDENFVKDGNDNPVAALTDTEALSFTTEAAGYTANPVLFDGTNDYLTRGGDLTGAGSSVATGLFSMWFRVTGGDGTLRYITRNAGSDSRLQFALNTNNTISLTLIALDGSTVILNLNPSTAFPASGGAWHHLVASWNLGTPTGLLYLDDAVPSFDDETVASGAVNWARGAFPVGARENATGKWFGDFAEFYLEDTFLDISVEANRRKFISASGTPVDLGADGSTPTGAQPLIYLANPTATWQNNLGTGGGFTENGALTDGTGPVAL